MFENKYEPKEFSDFMFPNDQVETEFQDVVDEKRPLGNLLFYGPYGTGKTSLAKRLPYFLSEDISSFDILEINASSQNRLTDVRNINDGFFHKVAFNSYGKTFVIIDEIDGMNKDAQMAWRNIITNYNQHACFFITSNDLSKVDGGIRSRFRPIPFEKFQPEKRVPRVRQILEAEGLTGLNDNHLLDLLKDCDDDNRELFRKLENIVVEFKKVNNLAA